jgi:hypothetical protein
VSPAALVVIAALLNGKTPPGYTAKDKFAGTVIVGATAVPVRLAVCGLLVALSVTVSVAVRVPAAVGVKVTLIVQLAPAASELPQLFDSAKSPGLVPVIATLAMVAGPVPVLVSVTTWSGPVTPTPWLVANVTLAVDRLATGGTVVAAKVVVSDVLFVTTACSVWPLNCEPRVQVTLATPLALVVTTPLPGVVVPVPPVTLNVTETLETALPY